MASNYTPNLNLSQWAAEDLVLRESFNADNEKIDAAVTAANARIDAASASATAKIDAATAATNTKIATDIAAARAKLEKDIADTHTKIDTDMAAVYAKIKSDITATEAKITSATNSANAKIEAASAASNTKIQEATAAADTKIAAANARIDSLAASKCEVVVGSYTGNGASERTINLGFTPKLVMVWNLAYTFSNDIRITSAVATQFSNHTKGNYNVIKVVTNGFKVYIDNSSSYDFLLNDENTVMTYVAFK